MRVCEGEVQKYYISISLTTQTHPFEVVKSAYGSVNIERKLTAAMVYLDQKLILIPLVFIFLRLWGTLRFFISFAPSCHTPCGDRLIVDEPCKTALYHPALLAMQALCDPGQGWGNALVFVVFHKTLLKRICPCLACAGERLGECFRRMKPGTKRHTGSPAVNDSSTITDSRYLGNDDEEDGHHTPLLSDECDKSLLSQRQSLSSSHM